MHVAEILASSQERFLRFVRSKVGSDAVAEDIVHGAYVKAVERAGDLESAESAVAWFYRILATATADHFRAASRERRAVEALGRESDAAVSDEPAPKACGCVKDVLPTLKRECSSCGRSNRAHLLGVLSWLLLEVAEFGDTWRAYAAVTPRWIPYLGTPHTVSRPAYRAA